MKRLIYQVYVGEKNNLYDTCISSVAQYCNTYNIDHVVQTDPILKIIPDLKRTGRSKQAVERLGYLPIYEKENAFNFLKDYDQVAIVDSDIYIKADSPNIFESLESEYAIGAVIERSMPCTKKYRTKISRYSKNAFQHLTDVDWKWNNSGAEFFNAGLLVINSAKFLPYLKNQTAKEFLQRPEFKDFVDGIDYYKWSTDQMLLNWWVKKESIPLQNMDWRWNGLYKGIDDKQLQQAYFVHFFLKDLLPEKGENVTELLNHVI